MTDNVERTLGRIEAGLQSLREDVQEIKQEFRIEIAKQQLVQGDLTARVNKQETFIAKVAAVAAIVGGAIVFVAEWLFKKVTS